MSYLAAVTRGAEQEWARCKDREAEAYDAWRDAVEATKSAADAVVRLRLAEPVEVPESKVEELMDTLAKSVDAAKAARKAAPAARSTDSVQSEEDGT